MADDTSLSVKKLVAMTEGQAKRIADYRFEARLASESEAIRRLIDLGLKAAEEGRAKKA